jgi:hypothetical protein
MDEVHDQREVCAQLGVESMPPHPHEKVGLARNVVPGAQPLNGLRHPPEGDTCGWYLWAGEELSDAPDFFEPVHVVHLARRCPDALPYLALPPGWRFLLAADYSDIWHDETLLNV